MELRQLGHFVAVAEELHFSRAARRVHIGQSSLSSSIAGLEDELGAALFVRDNRRVALTQEGRALLPAARRALVAADEGREAVNGVQGAMRGELRIGAIQTLGVIDLARVLAGYRRAHPGVQLRVHHDAAPVLARAVAEAELDIAFVDGPTEQARLHRVELGRDRLVLAVPRRDPLAARTRIRLNDGALTDRDFVDYRADSALRAQVDAACARAGLDRRIACETASMQYLIEFVRHGIGVAVLPPAAVRPVSAQVATIPIEPELAREICAVVAKQRAPSAATQALLELLESRPGSSSKR